MANPVEVWKAEKPGLAVWADVLRYAADGTPMDRIDGADLERMKWHGFFYRKRDAPGRYMNRIRITANELSADQAREIAWIAYEYGHGIVDITTRANVQVQGLEIRHLPKVAERLAAVGLTSKQTGHDNIRNVFGHPFSGLMPDELYDTRELCRQITDLFLDSPTYSDLPRKFNIALNGTDQHSAHFWTQDLSFLASRGADGEVLFQVLIGGTQGQNPQLAWHLPVLVRPEQVLAMTEAMLDLFRAKGSREKRNAARFRFLIDEIGVGGVLEWLEERLPFRVQPCPVEPVPASGHDELVGWFKQADRLWTMGLCVPLGRLTWRQLEGLAVLSKKWGDGQLRATHEQGIAVINIPSAFRDAAATDAAAVGLSIHADPLARNTVACTGTQFCNIAVTETKGHMFRLIERLREKALVLHGIRIHMSGCPSSCAQHFTADIGLKGVRVRRLLGTREGFDVYLGGGIAGRVHLALPYKLGVDVDQLPQLVEEVVNEYYLKHRSGQTFSAYWRERLREAQAAKVADADYLPPVWVCERCEHEHRGEDPPVFCPGCAGLRRYFARLEEGSAPGATDGGEAASEKGASTPRDDGFVFAARDSDLSDREGLTVTVEGSDYALFRVNGEVVAIDSACPHEGAPLAQGEIKDGVVTCPWHGWTFNACTGCSLDPQGHMVNRCETLVDNGVIYLKPPEAVGRSFTPSASAHNGAAGNGRTAAPVLHESRNSDGVELRPAMRNALAKPVEATLRVLDVIQETPDVRTFRLDNSNHCIPRHRPGQFAKVCATPNGAECWRSFTISSSPSEPAFLDLTIKLNPAGEVSRWLFEHVQPGDEIRLKGPQGGFYFDPDRHAEPLALLSAGSGITPMMSIVRYLKASGQRAPCHFIYGARTQADIIFHEECLSLAADWPGFAYHVSLSQPGDSWAGETGRVDFERLRKLVPELAGCRYFLCGPSDFMDALRTELLDSGVPSDRVHTEQFHQTAAVVAIV